MMNTALVMPERLHNRMEGFLHSWGCFRFFLLALFLCAPLVVRAGWVQQQSGTTAGLISVYFFDAQTGWVAAHDSGFIFRTTDGGLNWERSLVDTGRIFLEVVRFLDSQHGFVAGSRGLYKSTDGGLSWSFIPQSPGIMVGDIVFVTPQKGWLVSSAFYSGEGGVGNLFQTTDGGMAWVKRDSSRYYVFRNVAFADTLFGCYTGDSHGWQQPAFGFVRQTTDGGSTWQEVASGDAYGPVKFLGRNYAWRSLYSGWSYPRSWGIRKTTDQGQHWVDILSRQTWYCSCSWNPAIALVDTLKGWVLLSDTLFVTRDGGANWSWQIPPGRSMYDMFFTDSLNGWIVGYRGLILHTKDGGSGVWENPQGRFKPLTSNLSFSVVPNPFTSFATLPGHEAERFSLYDISGRKKGVYWGDRIGEGLSAGVYFLRPQGGNAKPVRVVKVR